MTSLVGSNFGIASTEAEKSFIGLCPGYQIRRLNNIYGVVEKKLSSQSHFKTKICHLLALRMDPVSKGRPARSKEPDQVSLNYRVRALTRCLGGKPAAELRHSVIASELTVQ